MKVTDEFTYVVCLHGNEQVPLICLASHGIPMIAGNPQAFMKNMRFIDSDLNAAFGAQGSGVEIERAKELLRIIPDTKPVVDFHSFSTPSEPFAIVVDKSQIPLARRTGLHHIVHMKMNIKGGHALINHRRGISVEVGEHTGEKSFQTTRKILEHLASGKVHNNASLYEVYDIIGQPGNYRNFEEYNGEFYPVLAGERGYKFHGLKAKKIS